MVRLRGLDAAYRLRLALGGGEMGLAPGRGLLALRAAEAPLPVLGVLRVGLGDPLHEAAVVLRIAAVEEDDLDVTVLAQVEAQVVRPQQLHPPRAGPLLGP